MSINHTNQPEILSGPFGSLLNDEHGISTRDAFSGRHFDHINSALDAYRVAGVQKPVTPTFGASVRGVDGGPFTAELREWNRLAVQLTQDIFQGTAPLGSLAPLLDTSGTDDHAWSAKNNRPDIARKIHSPQLEALYDAGIRSALAEAVHDFDEADGIVQAAKDVGLENVIVSFEPTVNGLPNNAREIQSYEEIVDRLRETAQGKIEACIGMNCGNADQIISILESSRPGTFSAVYPNQSVIPHNEQGTRFRQLADLNHRRTDSEELEFDALRKKFEISEAQLARLIQIAHTLQIKYLGLCCGANPHNIRELVARVHTSTPPSSH